MMKLNQFALSISFFTLCLTHGFSQSPTPSFWSDSSIGFESEIENSRSVVLDTEVLKIALKNAPLYQQVSPSESTIVISLPVPEGGTATFKVVESSVMAAELQIRFPAIRSYRGIGIENPAQQVHFDLTPQGFHAMIFRNGSTIFIDPVSHLAASNKYISYTREAFFKGTSKAWEGCDVRQPHGKASVLTPHATQEGRRPLQMGIPSEMPFPALSVATENGNQLRTYRLALACTGEYAAFHGGSVSSVLAAMNTSMVRVNGVFERDVAIRMVIVANNDELVFLNANTDPYTNSQGGAMLNENISTCNSVIGSANYDIGHVFSTGGGGVAALQSPCGSNKAAGVTGQGAPVGDPFDIDYVCHEMGHQFGANHTQNNSCNRASSAAYEPGSASTIMGYAGICSPNLQNNSDDHFHNKSCNEMIAFSVNGNGNTCASVTSTGNTPPTVEAGTNGLTIPASTPFELTATGSDADGNSITYNWEEYDLGPATANGDNNLTNPSGNQPIFRSWPSSPSPTRTFPRTADLVNGTTTIGELLPTYSRNLNFKCTVRDNELNGGGFADDLLEMTVDGSAGPFLVNTPNGGESTAAGILSNVTWDVAGTDGSAVNCSAVDIFLSTDGGYTWPVTLATNTPNDGSASVTFPNTPTSTARLKIKGSDHVFFDISDANFSVTPASDPEPYDAEISSLNGFSSEVCGLAISPSITVTNVGIETLNAFDVLFDLDNGSNTQTINWSGFLAAGDQVEIALCPDGENCMATPEGNHTLEVSVELTNQTDGNENNNSIQAAFASGCFDSCSNCGCMDESACNFDAGATLDDGSCILDSAPISFSVLTDSYPSETSWTITNSNGDTILQGGDYSDPQTTYEVNNICIAYGCYTLTVNDTYGDGMQFNGVVGNYILTDEDGNVLAEIVDGGNFGFQAIHTFCLELDTEISGCTESTACNYNPEATVDDGSCQALDACGVCGGPGTDTDGDGLADCIDIDWTSDLPENIQVECNAIPSEPDLTASGGCSAVVVSFTATTSPGICPNSFAIERTWTATDDCGTSVEHTQTVEVFDTTPPSFVEDIATNLEATCETIPQAPVLTATDNCTESLGIVFTESPAGSCEEGYTILRTWSTTDNCGNSASITQTITVQNPPPTCMEDVNGNGIVDVSDLLLLLSDFGCEGVCESDVNGDGFVGVTDILMFLAAFGNNCE